MFDAGSHLREYAAGLRREAEALRYAAGLPVQSLVESSWRGQRAMQLHERLVGRSQEIVALADQCLSLARTVDDLAEALEQQVRHMHQCETAVRSWMRTAAPEVVHSFLATTRLPDSGGPAWVQVVHAARRVGAPL